MQIQSVLFKNYSKVLCIGVHRLEIQCDGLYVRNVDMQREQDRSVLGVFNEVKLHVTCIVERCGDCVTGISQKNLS